MELTEFYEKIKILFECFQIIPRTFAPDLMPKYRHFSTEIGCKRAIAMDVGRWIFSVVALLMVTLTTFAQKADGLSYPTWKFGGRLMLDYSSGSLTGAGFHSFIGVRRLRFYMKGSVAPKVDYKVQVELAKERVRFKDLYLRWKVPTIGGYLFVGNQLNPISLVQNTSSKYRLFMEGPFLVGNFHKRNFGFGYYVPRLAFVPALSLQLAYLYTSASGVGRSTRPKRYVGKVAFTYRSRERSIVWYSGFGAHLIHWDHHRGDDLIAFTAAPSSYFLDYSTTRAYQRWDSALSFNFEQLLLFKRLGLQAEWTPIRVYTLKGVSRGAMYYAQIDVMLTNDRRNFIDARKSFGKVRPTKPLDWKKRQYGAFQIALRYNGMRKFRKADEWTLALNWYPYEYMRVMYNVGVFDALRARGDERLTVYYHQLRFQISI